jgi:acyl-CoA synthetase (AMP-forming)/AMP-acid ligase II
MTLLQPELLAEMAATFPDAVAWKDLRDDRELLMGAWHADSNRLARGLRAQGLQRGERVAIALTEDEPLEWLVSYMAVHKAGAVAVPVNTRLSGPEITRILDHAEVAVLLASPGVADPQVGSSVRVVATTGGEGGSSLQWSELLHADPSDLGLRLNPDDMADIMYTSGTTGAPKGVVVPHGGLSASDRVPSAWHGLGFLTSSPFSTTSGSLLVCGPMRGGLSGWFLPRFSAPGWLNVVTGARPVAGFLVPAMVQLIVADQAFESADLSSLAVVNIGSAPIAGATLRRFGSRLPSAQVMCGYGMTEFGAVTALPPGDGDRHLGSVGCPLPGVAVRIVDDAGNEVASGVVGQITMKGPRRQREYFRDPGGSERTWRDGWLESGDLGYLDNDGYLWIVGRQKEMIIRGGHNIVPAEVEAALHAHPQVAEAAVTGIPHAVLGEDVAAWVVPMGATNPDRESLRAFLLEQLADYKVPRRITFVRALPRNEAGKVLKAHLVLDDR